MNTIFTLTIAQLRMYIRDRQSLFFALFFPLFFMLALGLMVGRDTVDPIDVSVVTPFEESAGAFVLALEEHELLTVHQESEAAARAALLEGDRRAVIFMPEADMSVSTTETIPVRVIVDASQLAETPQVLAMMENMLVSIEREVRGVAPLFALEVEDVESRNSRYVDFLIPGLLAFMIMQLSVAGSGFNIVEYKRKGILKRLFVTPLRPFEFIASLIASRLLLVLTQVTLMLLVANLVFDISIYGSIVLLYAFAILGSILFLGIGFALGGVANTQNAVMAIGNLVIFPQIFLAGIFFSVDSLPVWLQPVAHILPLNFVSHALREIANSGATLSDLGIDILGIMVWLVIGVALAVRLFKWGESGNS
jgi:ABC-2 type transport system permease protein